MGNLPYGIRILLVDDEPHMLDYLTRFFERAGGAVARAADLLEALRHLESGPFDLVVTDKNLPGRQEIFAGGFEVLAAARAKEPPVPAVMISGFAAEQDVRKAESLGARAFLRKPFTCGELLAAVGRALPPRDGAGGEPGADPPVPPGPARGLA